MDRQQRAELRAVVATAAPRWRKAVRELLDDNERLDKVKTAALGLFDYCEPSRELAPTESAVQRLRTALVDDGEVKR